jgi:hypothetical protein
MPIKVQCGSCHKSMQAPDRFAGKRARCKCGAALVIPEARVAVPAPGLQAEADFDAAPSPVPAAALQPAAASARRGGEVCPNCQAGLAKEAVLCTNCGTLLRSGKQLSVSTEGESAPSARSRGSGQPVVRSRKPSGEAASAAIAVMLKLLKWGLLFAVVGGLAYLTREAISFDPRQQAKDALKKMKPGMTVQKVVDALALKPHEVHAMIFEDRPGQPFPVPIDKRLPYKDDFVKNTDPKLIENGFSFRFRYTERDVLVVEFDPNGNVVDAGLFDFMKALGM